MKIKFHGVDAGVEDHSAIELQEGDSRILITPSKSIKGITNVIVCGNGVDEWQKLSEYSTIPIYTSKSIAKDLPDVIKTIRVNDEFTIGKLKFKVFDTSANKTSKSIGLYIPKYKLVIIPEVPPQLRRIKSIIKNKHVIAGIRRYKGVSNITIDRFIIEAPKMKSLYITNIRDDMNKRRKIIDKSIQKYIGKGRMMKKGDTLTFDVKVKTIDAVKSIQDIESYDPSTLSDEDLNKDLDKVIEMYKQVLNPESKIKFTKVEIQVLAEKIKEEMSNRGIEIPEKYQIFEDSEIQKNVIVQYVVDMPDTTEKELDELLIGCKVNCVARLFDNEGNILDQKIYTGSNMPNYDKILCNEIISKDGAKYILENAIEEGSFIQDGKYYALVYEGQCNSIDDIKLMKE